MRELWPHQVFALEALRATIGQGIKRIVLCAPTGSGKTLLSAAIVDGALRKRKKVDFVCSHLSLIDQTVEAFYHEGITDVGVIQAGHRLTNYGKPVQVCSIQTLKSRTAFPEADVVIMDEVHVLHQHAKEWLKHPDWQDKVFIGLTATPGTRGLGKYFQTLIPVSTTSELIEQKYLSPFRVFSAAHPDLSGVKIVAGDYQENQLSEAMQAGSLTADIVKTWKDKWGKDRTLCFAVDLAHAKSIQERFEFAGIACGYQDASTNLIERAEIKKKFHSGEFPVVTNVGTLTTGADWDVRCLILARPTRSLMLFQQIIGRCLRIAEGKEWAMILDHSDTTSRLGFVTDIEWNSLDDGKPKDKAKVQDRKTPLPKECEKCAYLKPPKMRVCPNCGHENKIFSAIIEQDGELVEVTPSGLKGKGRSKEQFWSEKEKQVFFAELKGYAKEHGYKAGWAAMKYKDKFSAWPPRHYDAIEPASVMSPSVASWIRSRNIAFHKAKDAAAKSEMTLLARDIDGR